MASGFQRILLVAPLLAAGLFGAPALGGEKIADSSWLESEPLDPLKQERREIKLNDIDSEDFQIGAYAGWMSMQDFGVDQTRGLVGAFHVTEDLFLEGIYMRGQLGKTSFERLSGGAELLTDKQRDLNHYGLNLGFDILPGEAYIGPWATVNTALYLVGGVGSTEFGGDDRFTITLGMGYRVYATDWLSVHLDVRDHFLDSELLGSDRTYHGVEVRSGLTVFF